MPTIIGHVKAVFFDLGGTLAYYAPSPESIIARVIKRHGFHVEPHHVKDALTEAENAFKPVREKIRKQSKGDPLRYVDLPLDYWVEVNLYMLSLLGLPQDIGIAKEIALEFRKTRNVALYPDVVPTLKALRARGYRLGIVSNGPPFVEKVIKHTGLNKLVDFYVVSYKVGFEKPHPSVFWRALRSAAVNPFEALHVGDDYECDVEGARKVGMTPILLDRWGRHSCTDCIRIEKLDELLTMLT